MLLPFLLLPACDGKGSDTYHDTDGGDSPGETSADSVETAAETADTGDSPGDTPAESAEETAESTEETDSGESDTAQAVVTTYDLTDDFSDVDNPNGAWSFRAGDDVVPRFVSDWSGFAGQGAWAYAAGAPELVPAMFLVSHSDVEFEDLKAGDFAVHAQDDGSGPGLGEGRIVWTSPADGTIDVGGDLWLGRNIGRSATWALSLGTTKLAGATLSDGDGWDRASPLLLDDAAQVPLTGLAVTAGDELLLEVVQGAGSPYGDAVGIHLSVSLTWD